MRTEEENAAAEQLPVRISPSAALKGRMREDRPLLATTDSTLISGMYVRNTARQLPI